jgi:hypothetical protein
MAVEIPPRIFQQRTPHGDPLWVVHRISRMLQAGYVRGLQKSRQQELSQAV